MESETTTDAKQRFRDLFGNEELNEALIYYYANNRSETIQTYLRKETERKLREQDNE